MSVALQPDTRPDLLGDFNSLLHENSQTCAQPKKCRQSDRFVAFAGGRNRTFETSAARPWPRPAATSIPGSQEAQLAEGVRKGLPYFFCRIALAAGWQSGVTQSYPPDLLVKRQPLFNIPPVVIAVMAVLVLVQVMRTLVLSEQQDIEFLLSFAFIPVRYDSSVVLGDGLPGGGADIWTFVTYALIHADWTHLVVNAIWLLPFGSAVARRFGAPRFLAFFAVTAAAGATLHLATHAGEQFPM